ncbi:MAG: S8 family serine peptidase [Burkholderiales bacterium]|jgi:hypothetical protein|nr:S8 family serine peptidase [Burkholderiales bacterium]
MNPFLVQKYGQEAINNGYVSPEVPVVIRDEERASYIMRNIDTFKFSPGAERAKNEIVNNFSIRSAGETATLIPAFYANLNEREVEALKSSEYVVSVDRMNTDEKASTFSAYYDYTLSGEIVPWGKQAINADDSISVANYFYIIDSKISGSALYSEANIVSTDGDGTSTDHAASVISLATAKSNFAKIRGINPGQPVVHLGTTLTEPNLLNKLNTVALMSEQLGQFSTLNLSFNTNPGYANSYNHNTPIGRAIRKASGRLLIVQSAGNFNGNACLHAYNNHYGTSDPNDGILVVGGTDRFGDRFPYTFNPSPFGAVDRSNYGACVEVWAPGSEMTTMVDNGTLGAYTGTSFAAPLVAAVAGRYGDTSTRPIEREAYVRNGMSFTGKYEGAPGSNLPIYLVRYTAPSSHNISKRLPIVGAYSISNPNSSLGTTNLASLFDQKFYDDTYYWNAGSTWGGVVLDLGSKRQLSGVRVMLRSSASNLEQLDFAIHGADSISVLAPNVVAMLNNPIAYRSFFDQYDFVPYYIPLSGNYRYVMVEANNQGSWLAFSEVEIYGN